MTWYPPKPKRRPGSGPVRAAGRRPFGATWWGRAWVEALEQRARLDPNRLPRGRTYARTGAVSAIEVRAGEIVAAVQGSRSRPYRVTVRVRRYTEREWDRTIDALASQAGHLASLLDGEMPPAVVEDLKRAQIDLLPVAGEVQPRCSCPDWADPCKHSAAVCYLVADTLDTDPFLLFLMRGRDRESLLASLRATRVSRLGRPKPAASQDGRGGDVETHFESDPGLNAREVWARWSALPEVARPGPPVIPLPPPRPGRPTVLAVDPPAESGLTPRGLHMLAEDAVERAWRLVRGEPETTLALADFEDLARRAAAMVGPEGSEEQIALLASRSGMPVGEVLRRALAWRDGGREGLFVLLEAVEAASEDMAKGRELLGTGATVWRNRVTLGDRQLRLGRDGRWYPFRRQARRPSGAWLPDGVPVGSIESGEEAAL